MLLVLIISDLQKAEGSS